MKPSTWLLLLVLAGCEKKISTVAPERPALPGREETRGLENANPLGYEGTEIRAKVDQVLDANDKRVENLDRQIKEAEK